MGRKIIFENYAEHSSTIIDPEEAKDLIPNISFRPELDQFESDNIQQAYIWAMKSRKLKTNLLSLEGIRLLHKTMYEQVWKWSGQFRKTQKNIGVEAHLINDELHKLCKDVQYQIENNTYSWNEIAARFHHRLVLIHSFPNGNGRHARAAADLLLYYNKQKPLYWGEAATAKKFRNLYIEALRKADRGNYQELFNLLKVEK